MARYGAETPPEYDLGKVTAPQAYLLGELHLFILAWQQTCLKWCCWQRPGLQSRHRVSHALAQSFCSTPTLGNTAVLFLVQLWVRSME
jgi:hypothetical protein